MARLPRRLVQPCPKPPEAPRVTVRVSLFFDGTLNNRTNVGLGIDHENGGAGTSYDAGLTNIAKLEKLVAGHEDVDFSEAIYIEGIGTEDEEEDSNLGGALGWYGTGVVAKVRKGLDLLVNKLKNDFDEKSDISCLTLDVFGFSRGAAAARNFVHKATDENGKIIKWMARGRCIEEIKVRFVGLFDTVASHGVVHSNDTEDLSLDSIREAERVVQLAAAEEHRANFRLTNINSATNGREIFLPGVHSDIGGGYRDVEDENRTIFRDSAAIEAQLHGLPIPDATVAAVKREVNWLLDMGWCTADQIGTSTGASVQIRRTGIRNDYARIPLHIMVRFAEEYGIKFRNDDLLALHFIPNELRETQRVLDAYVGAGGASRPDDWFGKVTPLLRDLRRRYFHFSAYYGAAFNAHGPQWVDGNLITGRRGRIIQDG